MFDLDMFFIIYNCKDLGTSFFRQIRWLSRKNVVPLQTEQTLLIWKKLTLNNTDVTLSSMVSGK